MDYSSAKTVGVGVALLLTVAITIIVLSTGGTSTTRVRRGLQMIPQADTITYTTGDKNSVQSYIEEISYFLAENNRTLDGTFIECNDTVRPKDDQVCVRRPSSLHTCRSAIDFGYDKSTPCVLLALHLEESFKPEPYQSLEELPSDFPDDLRIDVERTMKEGKLLQGIWVDCSSSVNLLDPMAIFPEVHFDNIEAENYIPPYVGVQFDVSNRVNEKVKIECYAWAKNIDHNKDDFSKLSFTLHVKD